MRSPTNGVVTVPRPKSRLSQKSFAPLLEPSPTKRGRWERVHSSNRNASAALFRQSTLPIDGADADDAFTFVDIFAGIGGTRLGFEVNGRWLLCKLFLLLVSADSGQPLGQNFGSMLA